jgi:hypothetical protein
MALTPEQIHGLNAAAARLAAGTANDTDRTNLDFAAKNHGYQIKRDGADLLVPNQGQQTPGASTGAPSLDQWKNSAKMIEVARNVIQMKQKYNTDIQNAKQYWREQASDVTSFTGNDKQFTELSPAEQANIRSSRYGTAQAHLTGLAEEERYRAVRTEDTLKYMNDYHNSKMKELEIEKADANEKRRIEIAERQLALSEENARINNESKIRGEGLPYRYDEEGRLIYDDSKYDMPKVGSQVHLPHIGTGTITAFGSDLWGPGLDIALAGGTNADVKIPFDFYVVGAGKNGNFGHQVKVKNVDTGQELWVSHLSSYADLESGKTYKAGTSVGKQGNSGATIGKTGIHVDYTMPNGDGTYKTAQEVAFALGIGSERGRGTTGTIKATEAERKKFMTITGYPDSDVPYDKSTIDTLTWAAQEDYINNAVNLINNGDPGQGVKALKEEIVTANGTITNPSPEQVMTYLRSIYKDKLDKEDFDSIMMQVANVVQKSIFDAGYSWK